MLSGGLDGYLTALGSQAGEDFAWTGMLWTTPTPRRLLFALWETFVLPWESVPLGILVGVLAAAGALVALARTRYAVLCLALAFGPYAIFHLLFQETIHVRYAMPTLPAMAWLVVSAASAVRVAAPVASGLMVAAALWYAIPIGIAYGQEAHPAFRAIRAMQDSAQTRSTRRRACALLAATTVAGRRRPRAGGRRAASQLRVAWAGELLAWRREGADLVPGRPLAAPTWRSSIRRAGET